MFIKNSLFLLLFCGCGSVQIKDAVFCGSLGVDGAACFHTLTDEKEILTYDEVKAKWENLDNPIVFTNVETLTNYKSYIEKLCSFGSCTFEEKKKKALMLNLLNKLEK